VKNDPRLVVAARELRDRYLEHVNTHGLVSGGADGKYDVSRALENNPITMPGTLGKSGAPLALPAPAAAA